MSAHAQVFSSPPASAQALASGVERTVALPEVWVRVNRMIESGRHGARDIAAAIELDTDLTARLLRVVNSAFYALASRVETISRAVAVIGTRDLRDLAMLTLTRRLFTGIPPDLMDMGRFWRAAVSTGVYAGELGRRCNILHAERVFVMGVLCDIGQLVILQHVPTQAREILLIAGSDPDLLPAAEREVLGYTHAAVGAELLKRWRLPEGVLQAVRYHHAPRPDLSFALEVSVVHVAQALAAADDQGLAPPEILRRLNPAVRDLVPLDAEGIANVLERGRAKVDELAACFDAQDRPRGQPRR